MSYLKYISDEDFESIVKHVLDKGIEAKEKTQSSKEFNRNVIDPFGSLFEVAAFDFDYKTWKNSEAARQSQKTLQNHVGEMHQKVLGFASGWDNLETGSVIDLVCDEHKIIAEVKNKYNTVTGGKLSDLYESLERLVMPKSSRYKDYTAYFVHIIPKKPIKYDQCFTPSNKDKGSKCPKNEKIRVIDGASFYSMVTGEDNAIFDFYSALPNVIESVFRKDYGIDEFVIPDKDEFSKYISLAYKE